MTNTLTYKPFESSEEISTARLRALPAILLYIMLIVYIGLNGVNAPYYDEWYPSLDVAVASVNGTLTIDQLFRQHVEHRIVPTLALTAINARLTHWDVRIEMLASAALAGASFLMLVSLMPPRRRGLLATIAAALMFAPDQEWLWAFINQAHFALFFSIASIWACHRKWWLLGLMAAVCASFSFGWGVLAFLPAGALLWRSERFWKFSAGAALAIILWTVTRSGSTAINPLGIVPGVLIMIGNIFLPSAGQLWGAALIIGAVLALMALIVGGRAWRLRDDLRVWYVIGAWSLLVLALIASGRSGSAAMAARYTIPANVTIIALVVMAAQIKLPRRIAFAGGALALAAWILNYGFWVSVTGTSGQMVACITAQIDCDLQEYVPGDSAARIAMLRESGLSLYAQR